MNTAGVCALTSSNLRAPPSPSYSTPPHLTLFHSIVYSCRLRPFSSSAHRDCNLSVGYVNSFKSNLKTVLFQFQDSSFSNPKPFLFETSRHFFFQTSNNSFSNLKTFFFFNLKTFLFQTPRQLFFKPQDSSFSKTIEHVFLSVMLSFTACDFCWPFKLCVN